MGYVILEQNDLLQPTAEVPGGWPSGGSRSFVCDAHAMGARSRRSDLKRRSRVIPPLRRIGGLLVLISPREGQVAIASSQSRVGATFARLLEATARAALISGTHRSPPTRRN